MRTCFRNTHTKPVDATWKPHVEIACYAILLFSYNYDTSLEQAILYLLNEETDVVTAAERIGMPQSNLSSMIKKVRNLIETSEGDTRFTMDNGIDSKFPPPPLWPLDR